jgi:hypothetical protein
MNAFAASDLKAADPLTRPGDDGAPCSGGPPRSPVARSQAELHPAEPPFTLPRRGRPASWAPRGIGLRGVYMPVVSRELTTPDHARTSRREAGRGPDAVRLRSPRRGGIVGRLPDPGSRTAAAHRRGGRESESPR